MSNSDEILQKMLDNIAPKSGVASESSLRGWIDIVLKALIAGVAAVGTFYLSAVRQKSDQILAISTQQLKAQNENFKETHTNQVQQNEDVKFLVDMVDGDAVHRAIGLALARGYAASNRIPFQVLVAVNSFVSENSNLTQAAQINTVAEEVKVDPKLAEQVNAALPVRIYIQYDGSFDSGKATSIRQTVSGQTVGGKTISVPPTEQVKSIIRAPVLKCFRQSECRELGTKLVQLLIDSGAPTNLTLEPVSGYENSARIRPYHFEAWF